MTVCASCRAEWVSGEGFVNGHNGLCANERYGWNFVITIPDKPKEVEFEEVEA